ncbi:GNAT family N-acetyltransferase [Paenibacillus caseinilyticus]|uniref:GNAT family N-acetyltransferase n=1 Tax=Paenibacillus mucilaginosus TaxID=61624 RepID=UPI00025972B7|nr:GNAT family N-acetyltransferase [Paenibacillus mucilaginosus]WFA20832.1 GNAT family N-acetyltransferase [Paenibacillus mucilaginosus]
MRYTGEVWEPRRIICGLIAEEEGRAVGFGSMVIKNRFWQESYVGRITALVVEERMRGRGIGRTLIEELSRDRGGERVQEGGARFGVSPGGSPPFL